jgi:hypothetical protein
MVHSFNKLEPVQQECFMQFSNPRTLNNSRGEAAVIKELIAQGFVVNQPTAKNQPVYDLVVHLNSSIRRTAYIQVKTRGTNNPNGFRIGTKAKVMEMSGWLKREKAVNYFVVLVDFFEDKEGSMHVMQGAKFFAEVEGFAAHYLSKPKKDSTPRKETGAWTFNPKWSAAAFKKAKNNWQLISNYLSSQTN